MAIIAQTDLSTPPELAIVLIFPKVESGFFYGSITISVAILLVALAWIASAFTTEERMIQVLSNDDPQTTNMEIYQRLVDYDHVNLRERRRTTVCNPEISSAIALV
mmetsp:Transcript_53167/g.64057  ORF Transcript_53167/g.64057 Transcript_53167/m.64057 type:complete len:106 (-) Transcript_53167:312-629(-)